jgi:hypothetical protein
MLLAWSPLYKGLIRKLSHASISLLTAKRQGAQANMRGGVGWSRRRDFSGRYRSGRYSEPEDPRAAEAHPSTPSSTAALADVESTAVDALTFRR